MGVWEYGSMGVLGSQTQPVGRQVPTANRQPSTVNRQPPTANRQPSTANRQPPTANREPPTELWNPFHPASQVSCAGSIQIHSSNKTIIWNQSTCLKLIRWIYFSKTGINHTEPILCGNIYAQRLYISMGVTLSAVILCSASYLYFHTTPAVKIMGLTPDIYFKPVDLTPSPKPVSPPVRPSTPKPPVASVPNTPPLIVPPDKPIQPIANIEELEKSAIGEKALQVVTTMANRLVMEIQNLTEPYRQPARPKPNRKSSEPLKLCLNFPVESKP